MMHALAVLLGALLVCADSSPLPKIMRNDDDYRLPQDFIPEKYTLHITPVYLQSNSLVDIKEFTGVVHIQGKIKEDNSNDIKQIVLHHSKNIIVNGICIEVDSLDTAVLETVDKKYRGRNQNEEDAKACLGNGKKILEYDRERNKYSFETEKLRIYLMEPLTNEDRGNNIYVSLTYTSTFEGGLTGFYYSSYFYESEGGRTEAGLLATKFEPTYARQAYPCFDEPALKATFELSIDVQPGISAIANTEIDEDNSNENIVKFKESPKMTTYLLAFIVYEVASFSFTAEIYEQLEDAPEHKTWARKEAIEVGDGKLSQRDGPQMIKFMESYTDIKYTDYIVKMDQVALPEFQSGAMENWGLVTYRENALLYNKETGTTAAHKRVSDVLAHEIVHQWFGNLVVTKWWDSVWLNEGFANYFELRIMTAIYENWRMPERFVLDEQMSVFSLDSSPDSVPLTKEDVLTPGDIANHFGSISYSKGGAILRQIRNTIGEENFKNACRNYLKEYEKESATADDLLEMFASHNDWTKSGLSRDSLKLALETWTLQQGYPVITVQRESSLFKITQERFLQTNDTEVDEMPKYFVPLTWTISNETVPTEAKLPQDWLTNKQSSKRIFIDGIHDNQWVLFNSWQSGYYRVNYDDKMWDMILTALKEDTKSVAPIDRAAIIDNLLSFARAGRVSYERALTGIQFLRNDEDFIPWAAARTALAHLDRMLATENYYKRFIQDLVDPIYQSFEWDTDLSAEFEEDNVHLTHRANVFSLACAAGHTDCLNKTEVMLRGGDEIHNELQTVVYCYGLKKSEDDELWNVLWNEWEKAANNAARRVLLTTALGCTRNEDILRDYLGKSLNSSIVRAQDAYTVFTAVYSNPDGVDVALEFLTEKGYDELEKAYGGVRNVMNTIISGLANRLTTPDQKKRLTEALGEKAEKHNTALQTVDSNILWVHDFAGDIKSVIGGAPKHVLTTFMVLLCASVLTFLR